MIKVNTEALNRIKSQIFSLKGNCVNLCVNRGRKKYDTFSCVISDAYPSVFTVLVEDETEMNPPQLLSFSYTDVITKDIRMKLC